MRVAVIGAGSWGTAVSMLLSGAGHEVTLWARSEEVASHINEHHNNSRYLSEYTLPASVRATSNIAFAVENAEAVVMVTPSSVLRETAEKIAPVLASDTPVVILSKGVERTTLLLMTQVLEQVVGNESRLAVLSGPNHAEEVIKGVPSATVIASTSKETAKLFQKLFSTSVFRVYTSNDVVGVELCAAAKNIVAISCGMSDGLGFGDNTRATIITRGLAEIRRLVCTMGGNELTCMGLAGMGDLIATCTSQHSRNRLFGEMIANGQTLEDFTEKTHMVAEGAVACLSVADLAEKHSIDLPLTRSVREILYEGEDMHHIVDELFARELKDELD